MNGLMVKQKPLEVPKRKYQLVCKHNTSYIFSIQSKRSKKYSFDWWREEFMLALQIPILSEKERVEAKAINCMVYISCLKAGKKMVEGFNYRFLGKTIQSEGKLKILAYAISGRINDHCLKNGRRKLELVLEQLRLQTENLEEKKEIKKFAKDCRKNITRHSVKIICRQKEENEALKELKDILEKNVRKLLDPAFIEYDILSLKYGLLGNKVHTLAEICEKCNIQEGKIGALFYNIKQMFMELSSNTCPKDIFLKLKGFEKYQKKRLKGD